MLTNKATKYLRTLIKLNSPRSESSSSAGQPPRARTRTRTRQHYTRARVHSVDIVNLRVHASCLSVCIIDGLDFGETRTCVYSTRPPAATYSTQAAWPHSACSFKVMLSPSLEPHAYESASQRLDSALHRVSSNLARKRT